MELDDMKKIWNRMEERQVRKEYSVEEISGFRKARSRDFTAWIRISLGFDIVLKSLVAAVLLVTLSLYRNQSLAFFTSLVSLVALSVLIPYLVRIRRAAFELDSSNGSIQETLETKIQFLKKMYYKVQFIQSLTNPFIVIAGTLVYYYVRFGFVPPLHGQDRLIIATLVLLSFLFTLPATLSIYGVQLRSLNGCLSSLTDPDGWELEAEKLKKSQRFLAFVMYGLLILGIAMLALVMLL
ncbi:MAG TPA: hypothetical protein DC042_07420 [Bacteroidales bacterium]|nr:hypothetical protein [Bacteroidales bacterium]